MTKPDGRIENAALYGVVSSVVTTETPTKSERGHGARIGTVAASTAKPADVTDCPEPFGPGPRSME